MLIWMVFAAEPPAAPSLKFSSMGWTEWREDLKTGTWTHGYPCVCLGGGGGGGGRMGHSLVQHVEQLVEDVLAEEVARLCRLVLGRCREEGAVPAGQTRRSVPQSAGGHTDTHPDLRLTPDMILSIIHAARGENRLEVEAEWFDPFGIAPIN